MSADDQPGGEASADDVFAIDAQETLWTLARQLVAGQRTVHKINEAARTLRESHVTNPSAQHLLSEFEQTSRDWYHGALPNLIAAMQVAIEARDTFGPGHTRVDDPIDAALWNNKFFAWREQLGGPGASGGGDAAAAGGDRA